MKRLGIKRDGMKHQGMKRREFLTYRAKPSAGCCSTRLQASLFGFPLSRTGAFACRYVFSRRPRRA